MSAPSVCGVSADSISVVLGRFPGNVRCGSAELPNASA